MGELIQFPEFSGAQPRQQPEAREAALRRGVSRSRVLLETFPGLDVKQLFRLNAELHTRILPELSKQNPSPQQEELARRDVRRFSDAALRAFVMESEPDDWREDPYSFDEAVAEILRRGKVS